MKINWQQVYEGWRNRIVPPSELRELIEQTAAERMVHCHTCKWNSINRQSLRPDEHCVLCGCTLSAKVRCLSCQCALQEYLQQPALWKAVITQEQETTLKEDETFGES